jgi:hypothetical protein
MGDTHRETTKLSAEQATMFHVHGSTELISHPSITCNSSFILFFTAIRAATASSKNDRSSTKENIYEEKKTEQIAKEEEKARRGFCFLKAHVAHTLIVNTLGRKKTVRCISNHWHPKEEAKEEQPKTRLYNYTFHGPKLQEQDKFWKPLPNE